MNPEEQRESLAREFDRHVREESAILSRYHVLSDKLPEGTMSVLIDHIVTDEEMHHFLLQTLSEWMRYPEALTEDTDTSGLDAESILADTAKLREHERVTIEECTELKSKLAGEGKELLEGILDAISLDSQKHDRLLGLVEHMLEK